MNSISIDDTQATMNDDIHGHTLSVFVNNKPGVLMRICQVFARRGYNIDSLVVSHEKSGCLSRMTIGINGKPDGLPQIIKQVGKLIDVIHCIEHRKDDSVAKELALIKISAASENFMEITQIINHFGGKTVDMTDHSIIAMIHGSPEKLNWAIQMLSKFEIIETVRTGKLVIARSELIT